MIQFVAMREAIRICLKRTIESIEVMCGICEAWLMCLAMGTISDIKEYMSACFSGVLPVMILPM